MSDKRNAGEQEHLLWCRELVENSEDRLGRTDMDGRYVYANRSLIDALGVPREQIIGHGPEALMQILHPDSIPVIVESAQRAMSNRTRDTVEVRHRGPDGEWRWTVHTMMPWYTKEREMGGLEIQARDITEARREKEQQLKFQENLAQLQKMEAVCTLAGGFAHDFNNLLQSIMGFSELALERVDPDDPSFPIFKRILHVARRAKEVTLKMLTFAGEQDVEIVSVSLNRVVANAVELVEQSIAKNMPQINLEVMTCEEPRGVVIDQPQVERALLSILNNACESIAGRGTITVEIGGETVVAGNEEEMCGLAPGPYGVVRIRDTGAGMSEETRKRIFEPFFTTKVRGRGTGLGLSVAHGIIQKLQGEIRVRSKEGEGTEVSIYMPAADSPAARKLTEKPVEVRGGNETILVVDDEEFNLEIAEWTLKSRGYAVICADGGERAVEIFRERGQEIDLVLLDMIMPGMDGSDVFRAIREIDPDARVIVVSGYSPEGRFEELKTAGVEFFVQKPYSTAELCSAIRKMIDG